MGTRAQPRPTPHSSGRPARPHWKVRVTRLAAALLVLYGLWCLVLYVFQDQMIFIGWQARRDGDSMPRPPDAESWWLEIAPGQRVEAWFIPGAGRTGERPGPLVVFSHGNGELIDDWPLYLAPYTRAGASLLLPEFRGYARSGGRPGQAAITADFLALLERALERPEVDPRRVILHGRSIGGAALAQLATRRPPAAMILESSPFSLASLTWRYGVPPAFLRHPFRTDRVLAAYRGPLLLMHGTRDALIPAEHSRRLARLAPQARLVTFDAGHNDMPVHTDAYWSGVVGFLKEARLLADSD